MTKKNFRKKNFRKSQKVENVSEKNVYKETEKARIPEKDSFSFSFPLCRKSPIFLAVFICAKRMLCCWCLVLRKILIYEFSRSFLSLSCRWFILFLPFCLYFFFFFLLEILDFSSTERLCNWNLIWFRLTWNLGHILYSLWLGFNENYINWLVGLLISFPVQENLFPSCWLFGGFSFILVSNCGKPRDSLSSLWRVSFLGIISY